MPITASYAFKQAMKAPIKQLRTTIVLESGDSVITYTGNDYLTNLTINTSGNYFKAATGALEFTLLGVDYNLIGYKATVTLAVLIDADNDTWESTDIGYYRVTEQKVNLETGLTSFKGVDALGFLATQPYAAGTITYPITVADLATAVVANTSVGLITDVSTLPNGTYTIGEDLYKNISNVTYRDILGEVAGATATVCGALTGTGDVAFIPPQLTASEAISYDNLKTIKLKDRYGQVNTVVLSRQPQEDNVVVGDESIADLPTGKNLFSGWTIGKRVNPTDGGEQDNNGSAITDFMPVDFDENPTYYMSGLTTDLWSFTAGYNAQKEFVGRTGAGARNGYQLNKDIFTGGSPTATGDIKYLRATIYENSNTTGTIDEVDSLQSQLEVGTAPTDYEPFKPNGNVEVKLANNEILDDDRETLATPILDAVKGLYYSPFEATTEGHGWHTVGDRLAVYQTSPTLPLDYQELSYVENAGNAIYFDTGWIPDASDFVIDMTGEITDASQGVWYMFGVNERDGNNATHESDIVARADSTKNITAYWCEENVRRSTAINNIVDANTPLHVTFSAGAAAATIAMNGNIKNIPNWGGTHYPYTRSLFLGALHHVSDNQYYNTNKYFKIYHCSITENGKLVRNFIPCYRKADNKVGLFDTVGGSFYTASNTAGAGDFTKGTEVAQPQPIAEVVITDVKLNLTGGISETIKGEALTESQTNYSLAGGITKTIYNTEIKVDKQNQEITSVVSQLNQLSDSTAENFTQVNQTINNLTTTIQETGGGNIILNSVGYDTEPNGGGLVGWTNTGTVNSVTSPESISYGAVSGNEIDLGASSSITQRVTVDGSNAQKYSLSFKAKKSTVGQATVTLSNSIDNYVITLPAGTAYNWQSFDLTDFTASENYFDVTIATNSATTLFGITDLMLNVGNTTMQWVQASSEILNTQVAVTKNGVKVRSSVYDGDYVEITPLGFNGYSDASGSTQTVFTLNRDTTKVQKLRTESQMEMPPIKIVPITSGSTTGWAFVKMEDN